MKLTIKTYRAFERGMAEGVHRLFTECPKIQASQCGHSTKQAAAAFEYGYNLSRSDMYFLAWKGNRNLLQIAVNSGDVRLSGCSLVCTLNGVFIEEN